ncbi:Alpha-L-arabinofuranosidase 1 [Glycine max]|nr:Alpha-L-arabinofuranosidase 1 [Glycine max]
MQIWRKGEEVEERTKKDEELELCSNNANLNVLFGVVLYAFAFQHCYADANSTLIVNAASNNATARQIPNTFLGVFVEEINHAGAGGLWAELVINRGFEAGGPNNALNVYNWSIIGDESSISVSISRTSCFERNKAALQMEVYCGAHKPCPYGVGISNPGYWGMNIEQGKRYKVVYHVKSERKFDFQLSFTGVDVIKVASSRRHVYGDGKWKRVETIVEAKTTNHYSSLQITTTREGSYLLDQVSVMPLDTYMGHGFRNDLFQMVADLKPKFLRFPGGCYVEGNYLRNRFQWKDTIGPWEERPGHLGDVWNYWSDDGIGFFEYLLLAEDLGALPIWVFNAGFGLNDEIDTSSIESYVQDALDGIEFARGSPTSQWGSVRAAMGHPTPFDLRYVAVGNENCWQTYFNYQGNYLKFYEAIKAAYPDIQIISNCDASRKPLNHPADLFDFHTYPSSNGMFSLFTKFDNTSRSGPKAFVSEYAVKSDAANGNLLAAVAEAAFLIGLEKNSDIVEMVSYAPLFLNINDKRWIPDAIVFDSYQVYGTPSYWVQKLFIESSGATFIDSALSTTSSNKLAASVIMWQDSSDKKNYLRIKAVNFGAAAESLDIDLSGLDSNVQQYGSTITVLTSTNVMDENSFLEPKKVVPQTSPLEIDDKHLIVLLPSYSIASFEAGGTQVPSNIAPWTIVGQESAILLQTELSSCFERNKVALKMDVRCDNCPFDGVGVSHPEGPLDMTESLRKSEGGGILASSNINTSESEISNWKRMETTLVADASSSNSSLGGCFIEGQTLRNAFRWKDRVGPWEQRPGHFGDVWSYWTDEGFGYFEGLQLAEDIGARPLWEALDGIEFARDEATSRWGSLRASMGHPKPFDLKNVAIGNEDCGKTNYQGMLSRFLLSFFKNYLAFYKTIRHANPDIQIISKPLDHPADMYDYHAISYLLQLTFTYPHEAIKMFNNAHVFDKTPRNDPKYAPIGDIQAKHGTLLGAVSEAGFLIGLERNSDHVIMASYTPLFVNANDRMWNRDAIVFNSNHVYGTPSYWVQFMFRESNGATFLKSQLQTPESDSVPASAILWINPQDKKTYLKIKVIHILFAVVIYLFSYTRTNCRC